MQECLFCTLLLSNLSTISCTCQHTCCKVLLRNSNAPAAFKSNGDIYLPACPLSTALGSAETSKTIPSFVRTRIPGFVHCLETELKINIIRPLRAEEGGNEMDFSRTGLNNRARTRACARGKDWRRGSMTENVRSLVT